MKDDWKCADIPREEMTGTSGISDVFWDAVADGRKLLDELSCTWMPPLQNFDGMQLECAAAFTIGDEDGLSDCESYPMEFDSSSADALAKALRAPAQPQPMLQPMGTIRRASRPLDALFYTFCLTLAVVSAHAATRCLISLYWALFYNWLRYS